MPPEKSRLTVQQNYDRLSRWYDSISASERVFSSSGLRLLDARPGEYVLEIGFGTGRALIELARAVGETGKVSGIDLSSGMLAVSQQRLQRSGLGAKIDLYLGDATCLPFPSHHFQAVFSSFTLELFEPSEIQAVLAECRRILVPSGRLVLVSLAKQKSLAVKIYEWFHHQFPAIVDCRPILIRQELENAGFSIVDFFEKRLWGLPAEAVLARING